MRLTQRTNDGCDTICENCPMKGKCSDSQDCVNVLADRLAAYEDAEEQGRLVILPCKVGDTLFVPSQGAILNGNVDEISVSGRDVYVFSKHDSANLVFTPVNFGKTVFLSRVEAEAVLKKEDKA